MVIRKPLRLPKTYQTREQWLHAALDKLRSLFSSVSTPMQGAIRVGCGFPSARALSAKNRRIGECWSTTASRDGATEIIISVVVDEPMDVLAILAHECVHNAVGVEHGHDKVFGRAARAIGLDGKLTATKPGPQFIQWAGPVLARLGPYPHAGLVASEVAKKKDKGRNLLCQCENCGYKVRTTQQWLDMYGPPLCSNPECDGAQMEAK